MARLDIESLNFAVGGTHILRDVDLSVAEGECLGLLGPSGCGKTTTLRCIAGFARPTAGDVRLDGKSILGLPSHKRNVGLVFQDYALFPHMTVAENVAYGLKMRGISRGEQQKRVTESLETVQLRQMVDRMPDQLSGGQQQRVALARALVVRPDILLLDEPLGALDRKLRDQMQVELKRIQRDAGITTIIVTHDQEEALSLSDRVAVMFDGRIEEVGAPADLYRAPASRSVMEFLGNSNIFEGVIEAVDADGCKVRVGDDLVIATSGRGGVGDPVRVGVRPERFAVTGGKPPNGENVFHGRVAESVYKGTHAEIYVRTPEGATLAVRWDDDTDASLDGAAIGAEVYLSVPRRNVLLFGGSDD